MRGKYNLKSKVFLFLLLAMVSTAKAQDYLPLVKDNAEWNILWRATGLPVDIYVTESIGIDDDTLVNEMPYKKLVSKLSSNDYWQGNLDYELYGIIKEEPSGKVYYRPKDQDVDYLLYDFSMKVNDTAVMYWCQNPDCEVHVRIDSIATEYIAGQDRQVFHVSSKDMFGDDWQPLNTWIEGIGATEGLLYSCHVVNAGGITLHQLLCYHEDDELLYMNDQYNTCLMDYLTSVEENKIPNMFFDRSHSTLWFTSEMEPCNSVAVFNLQGQQVYFVEKLSADSIDLSELPKGLYIVVARMDDSSNCLKIIK